MAIFDNYLETEVLSADPIRLIAILYRGAIESVGAARRHLQAGAIRERSRQINRAMEILAELIRSLDHTHGGQLSHSLEELYGYMLRQLAEGNAKKSDGHLAEVEQLLTTLYSAWSALPTARQSAGANHSSFDAEYQPVSCTY